MTAQTELVVVGDGAAWIGNLAADHFPQATPILDWYHASQSGWQAAATIFGAVNDLRSAWARQPLEALWHGRVIDVRAVLER